ncbi:MAG: ATP/GTP-binding protein [Pseudomonadota bacterium]|nr:ATP/GTP-binding protein [Pseudomonadota bacterium]
MNNYKIIFTGPAGAGKSTAIATLSDIPVVITEEKTRQKDPQHVYKRTITVALDYGLIKLNHKHKIHLYGTPGQQRFDFMWDILTEGGLGLILLIDNARLDPLADLRFFLNKFTYFIETTQVAIGVTRMDISMRPKLSEYYSLLKKMNLNAPLFEVDARRKRDIYLLLQALLYSLDPSIGTQRQVD